MQLLLLIFIQLQLLLLILFLNNFIMFWWKLKIIQIKDWLLGSQFISFQYLGQLVGLLQNRVSWNLKISYRIPIVRMIFLLEDSCTTQTSCSIVGLVNYHIFPSKGNQQDACSSVSFCYIFVQITAVGLLIVLFLCKYCVLFIPHITSLLWHEFQQVQIHHL